MGGIAQKWLAGCVIGCAALVLIVAALGAMGFLFVRETFQEIESAEESHDLLVAAYGEADTYVPAVDGSIPAARLDVFVEIRRSLLEPQAELRAVFADFPPDGATEGDGSVGSVLRVARGLAGMIAPVAGYLDRRNRALLAAGMGPGEYFYIYGTVYYSWLGHAPSDGPVITKPSAGSAAVGARLFDEPDATFGPGRVTARYRRYTLAQYRNRLRALDASDPALETLAAEIKRLGSDEGHVAWRDGLPPAVLDSLAPYREALEGTYDATSNCFEVPLGEEQGGQWNFKIEVD